MVLIDPRLELGVVDVLETITITDLDCIKAVRCTVAAAPAAVAAAAVPPPPTEAERIKRAANVKARTKNKKPVAGTVDSYICRAMSHECRQVRNRGLLLLSLLLPLVLHFHPPLLLRLRLRLLRLLFRLLLLLRLLLLQRCALTLAPCPHREWVVSNTALSGCSYLVESLGELGPCALGLGSGVNPSATKQNKSKGRASMLDDTCVAVIKARELETVLESDAGMPEPALRLDWRRALNHSIDF